MECTRWMLACALLFVARLAMPTNYYLSPAGSDQNDGKSETSAWRTLAKVNASTFQPGDTVSLEGGSTWSGTLSLDSKHTGVTIKSFGSGRARIQAGANKAVGVWNVGGVTIQDLVLSGGWNSTTQSGNAAAGLDVFTDRQGSGRLVGLTIRNVEASGFKKAGIMVSAYPTNLEKSGFENVLIEGCDLHDNGAAGLNISGPFVRESAAYSHLNVTVRACKAWSNRGVLNSGSHSGNGIVISDIRGALIERCLAYNNGEFSNSPAGGPVGIWCWDADKVVIQHNESYNNRTMTIDGGGFDLDGGVTNSVLQYNYSHGNDGAGYLVCQFTGARPFHSNTVRYNISENDGRKNGYGGIVFFDGEGDLRDCEVYNNTAFVSPSASGVPVACKIMSKTKNIHIRNNIFVSSNGLPLVEVVSGQTGLIFQGNSYWASGNAFRFAWYGANYSNLSAWRSASGQEKLGAQSTGFDIDPRISGLGAAGTIGDATKLERMTSYRLLKSSPLINKGLDLNALFGITTGPRDFFGGVSPFQGKGDVGAYEFQPTLSQGQART